ncbi:hypothetical protein V8C42DRAFT_325536 [Trichoderma barbatum]
MSERMSGFIETPKSQSPPRRRRACEQCSKAKARCYFQASSSFCERCCKMAISCTEQTSRSLRKPRQMRLHDYIYNKDLAERQRSISASRSPDGGGLPKQSDGVSDSNPRNSSLIAVSSTYAAEMSTYVSASDTEAELEVNLNSQQAYRPLQTTQETRLFNITWPQADETLHVFRQKYMHHFPFVILENGISARYLEQRQPSTFKAIMLIAAPLPFLITAAMKESFFAHLGQRLFIEKEFNLDLLQCVLVCLAWADLCNLTSHQITNLTYTALGYAHNLAASGRSFNTLQRENHALGAIVPAESPALLSKLGAIDAHRAYLGCVSVLSADSARFGRQNPLSGPYVDICRSLLRQHPECPTDFVLERFVRMMQLSDKISDAFHANTNHTGRESYLTLVEETAQRLRPELDSIVESLGFDQQQFRWPSIGNVGSHERSFKLAYNYLTVRLYEPATRFQQIAKGMEDASLDTWRLCLTNCLSTTKAYFENLLAECPDGWYPYQSAIATKPIIFVTIVAARLLLIDVPGWNVKLAYPEFDLAFIIDRFVSQLEDAEETLNQDNEKFAHNIGIKMKPGEVVKSERLTELVRKSKSIKQWYEARRCGVVTYERFGDSTRGPAIIGEGEDSAAQLWWSRQPRWFSGLYENSAWNFDDI